MQVWMFQSWTRKGIGSRIIEGLGTKEDDIEKHRSENLVYTLPIGKSEG